MQLSWKKVSTIARREYLATVKRKAFIFTALGTPAYFAIVMAFSVGSSVGEQLDMLEGFKSLAVVDSSGLFQNGDDEIGTTIRLDENPFSQEVETKHFSTTVEYFPDFESAEAALRAEAVSQVLVIPPNYLETGDLRRYARKGGIFSSVDRRPIRTWLVRSLLAGRVDSLEAARVARPTGHMEEFALNAERQFEVSDDRRDLVSFLLPFGFAMLLGLCIVVGGQYLLFGVANEKESRILESLLCNVSAEELLGGKLLGLGASGLTLVAFWLALATPFVGAVAVAVPVSIPPTLVVAALLYFLFGYLFYASIMTGIGGITSNMREAQQFAMWFSFANFAPFIMITLILSNPNGPLPTLLSLFPPTAATTMMLRMTAPSSVVPLWQLVLSLALLAGAAYLTLLFMARIFRVGLLMYGKTPNLPEILRWARQK